MSRYRFRDYDRIRALLHINQERLGEELIEFPAALMEACEITIEAVGRRDLAEQGYRIALTTAAANLRSMGDKKPPETVIAAQAPYEDGPLAANVELTDAKGDVSYWQSLVECLRAKMSSMKRLSDLTVSGYIATGATYNPGDRNARQREELAEARASAPTRRQRLAD